MFNLFHTFFSYKIQKIDLSIRDDEQQQRDLSKPLGKKEASLHALETEVQQLTAANLSLSMRLLEAQSRKNPIESDLAAQLKRQMPRLLQLVHPDRNNNSPASNKLTVWLLSLRRTLS